MSGSGKDVQFVTLQEGSYQVAARVEGNRDRSGSAEFIVRLSSDTGSKTVINADATSWEGVALIRVGHAVFDNIAAGEIAVEVSAAGEWTVAFGPPPEAAPSATLDTLEGSGQGVQSITLTEGSYVVTSRVDGNRDQYGAENFIVRLTNDSGSELLANEIETSWEGAVLLRVGDGWYDDVAEGVAIIDVVAIGEWTIAFAPQPETAPPGDSGPLRGQGSDLQFVTLTEGAYVVTARVEGNRGERAPQNFIVIVSADDGRVLVANEIAAGWEGATLIRVGDSVSSDFSAGVVAVVVTAVGDWMVEFARR